MTWLDGDHPQDLALVERLTHLGFRYSDYRGLVAVEDSHVVVGSRPTSFRIAPGQGPNPCSEYRGSSPIRTRCGTGSPARYSRKPMPESAAPVDAGRFSGPIDRGGHTGCTSAWVPRRLLAPGRLTKGRAVLRAFGRPRLPVETPQGLGRRSARTVVPREYLGTGWASFLAGRDPSARDSGSVGEAPPIMSY